MLQYLHDNLQQNQMQIFIFKKPKQLSSHKSNLKSKGTQQDHTKNIFVAMILTASSQSCQSFPLQLEEPK